MQAVKAEALEPPATDDPPEMDAQRDRGQLDIVGRLRLPLPVTVIRHLLGVPARTNRTSTVGRRR